MTIFFLILIIIQMKQKHRFPYPNHATKTQLKKKKGLDRNPSLMSLRMVSSLSRVLENEEIIHAFSTLASF